MVILLPFFVALGAAIIPPLLWLFFFTRTDEHPEPPGLIAYTFALGGLMTVPTLLVQMFFKEWGPESTFILLVALALFEESFKFLGSYFAVGHAKAFDEPIDAMIYTITAALGFATIENFFNIAGTWQSLVSLAPAEAIYTATLRFTGATLLHALASALVGYFWARGIIGGKRNMFLFIGVGAATIVHTIFNFLIARFQTEANLIFPSVFLLLIAFFVFVDFEKLRGVRRFPSNP